MTVHDVDGLNAGYASALLEQYLENPDGVPDEWRVLFESGASELVATHPGLVRLLGLLQEGRKRPPPPGLGAARRAAEGGRHRPRRHARRTATATTSGADPAHTRGPRRRSPGRGARCGSHAVRGDRSRDA